MDKNSDKNDPDVTLEWKDYIALFIASMQTVFLPLVIMAFILFLIYLLLFVFHS